uniref:Intron-binding protein aquarius N-terminus n=1 Tax=Podoviridae sp. ct3rL24 TaxID=2825218 RepID=A0A8S5P3P2_9CAUD|nr:MAG TPA: Intron-binding protein aquarius N-terminus [Podoviridae sp. ct3rL24]
MAYKEKYPLDITPQGDTVPESIKKNRDELLNIAQQIELKAGGGGTGGGGGGGLRNRVLSGKVSNGEFSFLTGDNLSVMIDGSQTPVLVSFADGFNDYGAVDYIQTINRKQSAWSLPANSTSYLYIERSASGGLTYGSTTLEPLRQPNAPAAATDKMYYNTTNEKMNVYTGTYWKSILRVVVAIVVTDATRVKSIKYYDPYLNTATDAVIGTRTVDGKDYMITDILNKMAEAIKKIAGDTNFTNNPSRTLKALSDTVDDLSSVYYRKTDTVAEATHAVSANKAMRADSAATADNVASRVKKSGDTMTGTLKVPGITSDAIDLDRYASNKIGYSGFTFGECNNYHIWGSARWGTGVMFPWNTGDTRVLGAQLYFANSNAAYIRFDNNSNVNTEWQRIATFENNNTLTFPNGAKLKVE